MPGDTEEIEVFATDWDNLKYELDNESKEVQEKIIGKFTQMPVKLAWAITIHKSQGLTFEKAVIDAASSFAHGQVYVALSRCKTFEGMVLRSPIYLNSVKTDGTISSFTKQAEENSPTESHLSEAKASFQQSMLFELFDFKSIKGRLFYCIKQSQEHSNIVPASTIEGIEAIKTEAEKDIYTFSEAFQRELSRLLGGNVLPEENPFLQERVKKGCNYFFEKVQTIFFEKFKLLSFDTDNKAVNKTIREVTNNFQKEVTSKLAALNACKEGFDTNSYIKAKANAEIDFQASESTTAAKATPGKTLPTASGIPNPQLYKRLKDWRDELAEERNVPVYIILPSKSLLEIIERLPATPGQLEKVKGIGKQKLKEFGTQILAIIHAYYEEKNLNKPAITEDIIEEPKIKQDTKKVSLDMFLAGLTIEEISTQRNLTSGTIEGHLSHFIPTGEIEIYQLVKKEKVETITDFLQNNKPLSLTEIKNGLGDGFSYGEIRIVLKHLERETSVDL